MKNYRIKYRILPWFFMIMIAFPLMNGKINFIQDRESSENRKLAELPKLDIGLADPFPQQYENYFNDHVSIKNNLVYLKNYIKYFVFKESPLPANVHLGKDRWFYFNNELLPAKRRASFFNKDELERFRKELEYRHKYFSKHNALYFLAIVPAKASIYPEFTRGDHQYHTADSSRTDQLLLYLHDSTDCHIIDLRKTLLANKPNHQVFHRTDHHWNYAGAVYGSLMILDSVRNYFPRIPKINFKDFKAIPHKYHPGDLVKLTGLHELIIEKQEKYILTEQWKNKPRRIKERKYEDLEGFAYNWAYEVRRSTSDTSLPNAMIIRDSYGNYITNILSAGFNNTLFVWDKWEYKINESIFENEDFDVYITMITEAQLFKLLQQPER